MTNAEKSPLNAAERRFGSKVQSNNRLVGMTAAEKLKVEKDEERAHRHLSRRRRRHSIAVSDYKSDDMWNSISPDISCHTSLRYA